MAAAVLLPLVLLSAIALGLLLKAEREAAQRSVQETARLISLAVDQELASAESALRVLAGSAYLAKGDLGSFYAQAVKARTSEDAWILLYAPDGQQLVNTRLPFGAELPVRSEPDRTREVLETGKAGVSNLYLGTQIQQSIVTVDVPVQLDDGRRYVLAQAFRTGYFSRVIGTRKEHADWIIGIFDRNHLTIARSHRAAEFVGRPGAKIIRDHAKAAPEGAIRHPSREGIDILDVYTRSARSGWVVAIGVPYQSLEASATRAVAVAALGAVGALAFATAIAFLIGRRLNLSIAQAAQSAGALGRGEAPPFHRSGIDEVDGVHAALSEAGRNLAHEREARAQVEEERARLLESEHAARERAEAQNRAKDEFLAMLGHELRNPLSAISGAASVLTAGERDKAAFVHASEIIGRQTRHLSRVVDDLLDLSRVMTGKIALDRRPVELAEAVRHCLATLKAAAPESRHKVVLKAELVWVYADVTRLDQIITNLLTNAFKYTAEDGSIEIKVGIDGPNAVLTVRDSGIGISPQLLPQIFDVFFQGDASIDRARGGLGIGLALVRQLALLHGGTVTAASDGPGTGSVFTVRIPLAPAPAESPAPEPDTARPSERRRVLLVDDHEDSRRMLSLLLQFSGHEALEACDGSEGLRAAAEEKPDVAVIDIGLPGTDGYEVARRLRADPATRSIPLIALTGYGQEEDRRRALEAGFDLHLVKPVEPDRFLRAIATFGSKT